MMCRGGGGAVAAWCEVDVVSCSGAGAGSPNPWARQASSAEEGGHAARQKGQRNVATLAAMWATRPK